MYALFIFVQCSLILKSLFTLCMFCGVLQSGHRIMASLEFPDAVNSIHYSDGYCR
jgi:hypothetical protein